MILGRATIAALETPIPNDGRERGTDSTKNMKRAPWRLDATHIFLVGRVQPVESRSQHLLSAEFCFENKRRPESSIGGISAP